MNIHAKEIQQFDFCRGRALQNQKGNQFIRREFFLRVKSLPGWTVNSEMFDVMLLTAEENIDLMV
jgi:hypothetical protein